MAVGITLNLNKWIYFNMRIGTFINIGKGLSDAGTIGSNRETLIPDDETIVRTEYSNSVVSYQPRNSLFDSQMRSTHNTQ